MERKYYKHKIENLIVIGKIVTVHYFEFDKRFKSKGEAHDFWELVYVDRGELICNTQTERFVLKEGEACFHKPNEFHAHESNGKWFNSIQAWSIKDVVPELPKNEQ